MKAMGVYKLTKHVKATAMCQAPTKKMAIDLGGGLVLSARCDGRLQKGTVRLSDERRRRLDKLGFIWDVDGANWEEGFSHLKVFSDREGHCRVSYSHKEGTYLLGQWVRVQRERESGNAPSRLALSDGRRKRLDELGFVWDPVGAAWEEGFKYLTLYRDREGHCRVPDLTPKISLNLESGRESAPWGTIGGRSETPR